MRFCAAALLLLMACDDFRLEVRTEIPADLEDDLVAIELSVLVPNSDEFTCESIAFREIDESAVLASVVDQVLVRRGDTTSLDHIPRESRKLLYSRGLDAEGEELAAGCAEVFEIEGEESVVLPLEYVTVAVSPGPLAPAGDLEFRITRIDGTPLANWETRWTQTGPGSDPLSSIVFTDDAGQVAIERHKPLLPGPVTIEIFPKWVRGEIPATSFFRDPAVMFDADLPNSTGEEARLPEELFAVGHIGPAGEIGVAGLSPANASSERQVYIGYRDPSLAPPVRTAISTPIPAAVASIGLVSRGGRDAIIGASLTATFEIAPNGGVTSTAKLQPGLVRRYLSVTDCESGTISETIRVFTNGSSDAIDADQQVIASDLAGDAAPGFPVVAGCVSSSDGEVPTVVYDAGQEIVIRSAGEPPRETSLAAIRGGFGFSPATDSDPATLLATTLDLSGTNLDRYTILPVGESDASLELRESDPTPTFALSAAGGDFDGDGLADVAALLTFGDADTAVEYRIFISLGLESRSGRVVGISRSSSALRPRLWVADFDEDGYDDIMVTTPDHLTIFSMGEVDVP
jgi:hypothetical protein